MVGSSQILYLVYKIGICCFSVKLATLRSKMNDWLARNQNNVSEWSDMSFHELLFQYASTIKIHPRVMVYFKTDVIIISLKCNLFFPWCSWKIAFLALNNNCSLAHPKTSKVYEKTPKQCKSDWNQMVNGKKKYILLLLWSIRILGLM